MKKLFLLAVLVLSTNCRATLAYDDYEVNPDAPNGYNASMAAYHYHGSYRAPTQEQNGYAASEARSRFGANPLLVPKSSDDGDSDGSGRWGGGSGSRWGSRWGSDDSSNGGGNDYWSNHFHRRCQPQENQGGGGQTGFGSGFGSEFGSASGLKHPAEQIAGAMLTADVLERYRRDHSGQQGTGGGGLLNPYTRSPKFYSGSYSGSGNYNGQTALRSAVEATPIRSLLRDSQGGFNRIYTDQ